MTLSKKQHEVLIEWIQNGFIKWDKFNHRVHSYKIQYWFETSENGFYIDNETVKSAMLECGFRVYNDREVNWEFNISPRSPECLTHR